MTQRDPSQTALESRLLLAAKVIVAPASYEFRDMGFDPTTQEVGIVGYEGTGTVGVTKIAKLFELNGTQDGFTAQTLVGLGPGTQVFGISSDAYRIAGISQSAGSVGGGEGTTWTKNEPTVPTGIGFVAGRTRSSWAFGAWHDGIVRDASPAVAFKWTTSEGIILLPSNTGSLATAVDSNESGTLAGRCKTQLRFSASGAITCV